jgi:hypothetical protein
MPADANLVELAARVGEFHITQRAMREAQHVIEAAIAEDRVNAATQATYLAAVRRYFGSFDSEARAHLHDVDKRLERTNQIHFNLTAERGVAVKRIEATSAVLDALAALEGSRP